MRRKSTILYFVVFFALFSLLPSFLLGSVPSFEVIYRQSVVTNEVLSLRVCQHASTSAVPVEVGLSWKDSRGTTLLTFDRLQTLSTNADADVEFKVSTGDLKAGSLLYPQVTVVPEGGVRQIFAYGFCPVDIRAQAGAVAPVVRQKLPPLGWGCPVVFSISGPRQTGEWEARVSVVAAVRPKLIEVLDEDKVIYRSQSEGHEHTFDFRPMSKWSVLRVRMTDEADQVWYGSALRVSRN